MKIQDASILITGGAGFVGSHIVDALLREAPRAITIVDNLVRGSHRNMAGFIGDRRITFVEGDIRDRDLMARLLQEADCCIHTAALRITQCAENPLDAHQVMADATLRLVDAARRYALKKIVFSSSASVYGMARTFPTTEDDPPYDNRTLYGACKLYGEQLLRAYYDMYRLDYVALRYFNVYGPRMDTEGKYTEVLIRWLECIQSGVPPSIFGDGSTTMDFVFVTDVARANVAALQSEATDVVLNIGSSRETSLLELLQTMLALHGSNLEPEFHAERKVNPVRRRLASVSRARDVIGFAPTVGLEEGLRRLGEWYAGRTTGDEQYGD